MYPCPIGAFPYMVQPYDTLTSLARRYRTTVSDIISLNPDLDTHYPRVGQIICIRCGRFCGGGSVSGEDKGISKPELELRNQLRLLWEQHVAWTRMAVISTAESLADESFVLDRLLKNPGDFADVLKTYYGNGKAKEFKNLFTSHLTTAAEFVKAAKAGDGEKARDSEKRWYENADQIADFLGSINPNWSPELFKNMLHEHLALTKSEAVNRLSKNYLSDIADYDRIEQQALMMADEMSTGIIMQFPERFEK